MFSFFESIVNIIMLLKYLEEFTEFHSFSHSLFKFIF